MLRQQPVVLHERRDLGRPLRLIVDCPMDLHVLVEDGQELLLALGRKAEVRTTAEDAPPTMVLGGDLTLKVLFQSTRDDSAQPAAVQKPQPPLRILGHTSWTIPGLLDCCRMWHLEHQHPEPLPSLPPPLATSTLALLN